MEFIVTQIDEIYDNQGGLAGYQCFDGTGQSVKVKKGQGGHLKERWGELQVGRAYTFTMGEFKGYPFVQDFKPMSEALADKMPPIVKEAVKMGAEVITDPKNRSYALSYAKDIAVAKMMAGEEMSVDKVIDIAKKFARYLDTGE